MNRRTFVAACGVLGVSGVAGCVGDGGSTGGMDGYVRPDSDPEVVPASMDCPKEDVERHYVDYSEDTLQFGDTEEFSLRSNGTSFEYGETVQLTLRNTSGETVETGNRNRYSIECYTEAGWREVRVWTAEHPLPYTDEAIPHDPGDGFEWDIELTDEGVAAATIHDEDIEVCPPLQSGRYRFAYFGLIGEEAIAVEVDLTQES